MFRLLNDKLFTHLFIALVLIAGTLCDPVAPPGRQYEPVPPMLSTIKCYVCSANECGAKPTLSKLNKYIKTCTGFGPACEIGSTSAAAPPQRGCIKNFSELRLLFCIGSRFEGDTCSKYTNDYSKISNSNKLRKCNDLDNKESEANYDKPSTTNYCLCNKDLCNDGPYEPEPVVPAAAAHTTFSNFLAILMTFLLI